MASDRMRELAQAIAEALEATLELDSTATRRLDAIEHYLTELGDDVAALSNRIGGVYETVRPHLIAKSSEQPMRCAECGAVYGAEPGPPLCGPCWTRLGRPDAWPPVSPLRLA